LVDAGRWNSAPLRRVGRFLDRPIGVAIVAGLIIFGGGWFVVERYWTLHQRTLAGLAILNAHIASAGSTEDDLVTRAGQYLAAEQSIVDAYDDQLDDTQLAERIGDADKARREWSTHEEVLRLEIRTHFPQDDIQAEFSELLTMLDSLSDDVDDLQDDGSGATDQLQDAVERCRDDVDEAENAIARLALMMSRHIDSLATPRR
jgi:hypothetical protein